MIRIQQAAGVLVLVFLLFPTASYGNPFLVKTEQMLRSAVQSEKLMKLHMFRHYNDPSWTYQAAREFILVEDFGGKPFDWVRRDQWGARAPQDAMDVCAGGCVPSTRGAGGISGGLPSHPGLADWRAHLL